VKFCEFVNYPCYRERERERERKRERKRERERGGGGGRDINTHSRIVPINLQILL